jgi:3-hydroxyisobutyrate dehydrogenase-like beta-hydroxyacid dehydrogenase
MKVGFIGLGTMGSRMAAHLLEHKHSLVVYNRTREKAGDLLAKGAIWADSPAALAPQVEVIFTMLADPAAVEDAALGRNGLLTRPVAGQLWVDSSTVDPSFSKAMAARAQAQGVHFLGAPVTGSKGPAAAGKLIFWVGGDAADLEKARPLLECMGNKIVHCGGQGAGASLKMVVNLLLGIGMATFAEGLVLGQSLGLSRDVLFDAILGSPAAAPFLAGKRERIEKNEYSDPDFALRWLQKDLHLAAVSAFESGAASPMTSAAKELYRLAMRHGSADLDFSAIYQFLAQDQKPHKTS